TLSGFLYSLAAVAIQRSDHSIVVAGTGAGLVEALERLNWDGSPDTNFGNGGIEVTSIMIRSHAASVKIAADGEIVVGASGRVSGPSNYVAEFMVTRFDPKNGSLDTSFGTGGVATVPYATLPTGGDCNDMAFEPNGRIVVVGLSGNSSQLTRFLPA